MENFEFFAFDNDKFCPINLGIRVNPYPNTKEGLEMNNTHRKGIRWYHNSKKVEIKDSDYVKGYPTVEMDGVVAIYSSKSKIYPEPANAVIYNPDGSFRMRIEVPDELLSSNAKRIKPRKDKCFFFQAGWALNSKGEKVNSIWIGFANGEYFEVRELNTETGEFGELLTYGRM